MTKVPMGKEPVSGQPNDDHKATDIGEGTAFILDHTLEKRLCWKFDLRLLPVLAIMCKSVPGTQSFTSTTADYTMAKTCSMRSTKATSETHRQMACPKI